MVTMRKIKTATEINPVHLFCVDLGFQPAYCSFSVLELNRAAYTQPFVLKSAG